VDIAGLLGVIDFLNNARAHVDCPVVALFTLF